MKIDMIAKLKSSKDITRINRKDEDLGVLYDLWFSKPNLDLRTKDDTGASALEYVEKFPYRANLIERIRKYERRKSN